MKRLHVFYKGWGERWPLGILAATGPALVFEYSTEALAQKLELSPFRTPVRTQAYAGSEAFLAGLPGFIADALPDGWGLLLMDRAFRKAGRDPSTITALDRLAFIGDRAMGALSFEPAESWDTNPHDVALLDLAQRVERFTAGASAAVLNELVLVGGSPHGARPKALVHFQRGSGTMAVHGVAGGLAGGGDSAPGEPWLIKFAARGEHAEACAIEELYACLARACGIDMPESAHFPLSRQLAAFGVKRFDRDAGRRVPVLTLAGALHTDYRLPSVDAIDYVRLTQLITNDVRETLKAFERCVFNLVFNNRDDHAKNFSYRLGSDRRWRVSPAYDLTFNTGPRGHHQLAYAGETLTPGLADLLRVADKAGIDAQTARNSIEHMTAAAGKLTSLAAALPIRKATVRDINKTVAANCARLAR